MNSKTAAALREEADRIEAEELKAERLKTADTVPTCPNCGGRYFTIGAWTIVTLDVSFEEADNANEGEWGEDYKSGDHGDTSSYAECASCGADVAGVLKRFGWKFYGDPVERS